MVIERTIKNALILIWKQMNIFQKANGEKNSRIFKQYGKLVQLANFKIIMNFVEKMN
ncbi:MAG: hypothetical protein U0L18_10540 [Acutalibacteraceae bacterium]|nr:hypothetical protein [Acutalibacteraceae bacterium]